MGLAEVVVVGAGLGEDDVGLGANLGAEVVDDCYLCRVALAEECQVDVGERSDAEPGARSELG